MLGQPVVVIDPVPEAEVVGAVAGPVARTADRRRNSRRDARSLQPSRARAVDCPHVERHREPRGRAGGARPQSAPPVVMRVQDDAFAGSVERQFEAIQTLSTSSLAAQPSPGSPASRGPGSAHRIRRRGLQRRRAPPGRGSDTPSGGALRGFGGMAEQTSSSTSTALMRWSPSTGCCLSFLCHNFVRGRRAGDPRDPLDEQPSTHVGDLFMLQPGARVPDVGAETMPEKRFAARPWKKALVVYFYPRANTPGCTNETIQFRDLNVFTKKGVTVVGVSRDTVTAQANFKAKYDVPFALLADVESDICDAFGVIVEKNMYGKKSLGIQRSTFLIRDGRWRRCGRRSRSTGTRPRFSHLCRRAADNGCRFQLLGTAHRSGLLGLSGRRWRFSVFARLRHRRVRQHATLRRLR